MTPKDAEEDSQALGQGVAGGERVSSRRCALDRRTCFADLPELLTPEEFRAVVGIGRTAMYEALRRGEIRHLKFGRTIRIPKAALRTEVE